MTFQSFHFLIFFLVVFALNRVLSTHYAARRMLLLVANYYFYMCWDARFCVLLAGITLVNHLAAKRIAAADERGKRLWLGAALAFSLGTLAYFKYANFFIESTLALAQALNLPANPDFLRIVQPIGISFFTFQALSYTLDVYRGHEKPARGVLDYALFVSFFPTLLSGPITRARDFLGQLARQQTSGPDFSRADEGLALVLRGLVKKVIFADLLAVHLVDPAFTSPGDYSSLFLVTALFGYTLQIYMDLSGYTDIARGVARLLGFELPRNFDRPYLAPTLSNFWQRWHISMSSFFRDYLFFSLGGSRHGNVYRNLLITFVAIGAWHGAGWNFILYGLLHGCMVCWERTRRDRLGGAREAMVWGSAISGILVTFNFVVLTRLLFRAEDLSSAGNYLYAVLSGAGTAAPWSPLALSALAIGALAHFVPAHRSEAVVARVGRLAPILQGGLIVAVLLMLQALSTGEAPFIYFEF